MDSAFMYFDYIGVVEGWGRGRVLTAIYECKECLSLVREQSVPDHFSKHGIA